MRYHIIRNKRYYIARKQVTPPGQDRIVASFEPTATEADVREKLIQVAREELISDPGAQSIAYDSKDPKIRAAIIGQPVGTGIAYSINSTLARYEAVLI